MVFCVEYGTEDLERVVLDNEKGRSVRKTLREVCPNPERLSWCICWLCGKKDAQFTAEGKYGIEEKAK